MRTQDAEFTVYMGKIEKSPEAEVPPSYLAEKEPRRKLFHVSGYAELANKKMGDSFFLHPGQQGAEGSGVYFSENTPRFTAAEGARKNVTAVIVIEAALKDGWWRSKGYVTRKFGRPRTWHSDGKSMLCSIKRIEEKDGMRYLFCDWEWNETK